MEQANSELNSYITVCVDPPENVCNTEAQYAEDLACSHGTNRRDPLLLETNLVTCPSDHSNAQELTAFPNPIACPSIDVLSSGFNRIAGCGALGETILPVPSVASTHSCDASVLEVPNSVTIASASPISDSSELKKMNKFDLPSSMMHIGSPILVDCGVSDVCSTLVDLSYTGNALCNDVGLSSSKNIGNNGKSDILPINGNNVHDDYSSESTAPSLSSELIVVKDEPRSCDDVLASFSEQNAFGSAPFNEISHSTLAVSSGVFRSAAFSDDSSDTESTDEDPVVAFDGDAEDSDTERNVSSCLVGPRVKGELAVTELPPIDELKITINDEVALKEIGKVISIVDMLVVVKGLSAPVLDEGTALFQGSRVALGRIFETFGPVQSPFYSIRFNAADQIKQMGVQINDVIFYAPTETPNLTQYVFVSQLQKSKGSDASWLDNHEPPERFLDYSDDEQERAAKAKLKAKNRQPDSIGSGPDEPEPSASPASHDKRKMKRGRKAHNQDAGVQPHCGSASLRFPAPPGSTLRYNPPRHLGYPPTPPVGYSQPPPTGYVPRHRMHVPRPFLRAGPGADTWRQSAWPHPGGAPSWVHSQAAHYDPRCSGAWRPQDPIGMYYDWYSSPQESYTGVSHTAPWQGAPPPTDHTNYIQAHHPDSSQPMVASSTDHTPAGSTFGPARMSSEDSRYYMQPEKTTPSRTPNTFVDTRFVQQK